jgi:hypothetical protein
VFLFYQIQTIVSQHTIEKKHYTNSVYIRLSTPRPRKRWRRSGRLGVGVGAQHGVGLRGRRPGAAGPGQVAGRRGEAQGAGHLSAARGQLRGPLPKPPPLPRLLLPRPLRAGARRPRDHAHQGPPRLPGT